MNREGRQKNILSYNNVSFRQLESSEEATATAWGLAARVAGHHKDYWQPAYRQSQRRKVSEEIQPPTTEEGASPHVHDVLWTNLRLAVQVQKNFEFDAEDASPLLFTSDGKAKKRLHRKMLPGFWVRCPRRITTSIYIRWWSEETKDATWIGGGKCESHASAVKEISPFLLLVYTTLFTILFIKSIRECVSPCKPVIVVTNSIL